MGFVLIMAAVLWGVGAMMKAPHRARWAMIGMLYLGVVLVHVLRNSMIPVVTIIALGIPSIFGGAIITEQVFKVNGIGQLLITAIQAEPEFRA